MKKTTRKVLLMACSALLLVCLTVSATVAYLTYTTGVVTNTFTVGNVTITLDETKVDVYGAAVVPAARTTENTYKLIPGHDYIKDPTVHVAEGSEKCWLFVKVEDEIAGIQDATTVADQMATLGWSAVAGQSGVYAYREIVDAAEEAKDLKVFESFKILGTADVGAYDGKTIKVQAYAVQADGFDTAAAAYAAAPCTWGATNTPAGE